LIVLADMDAIGSDSLCQLGIIIDDKGNVELMTDRPTELGAFTSCVGGRVFFAKLDNVYASIETGPQERVKVVSQRGAQIK
jgi:hypothetical protein